MREIQGQDLINQGLDIARAYESGKMSGWFGEALAKRDFNLISPYLKTFSEETKKNAAGKKVFLYHATRKLLTKDTPNYPQEIGDPFIAGTKVLMDDGSEKNIEDIQIGETVINHKNEKAKVTNVIKKKFSGKLVTIKVKGWHRTVTATEFHHGLLIKLDENGNYLDYQPKKFGELNVGDYQLIPYSSIDLKNVFVSNVETPFGLAFPIENISSEEVVDHDVYCITTENEFTAIFNGVASRQCVSFSAKNGVEYLSCCDIILRGDREKFRLHFPPWYYGASRVLIGGWDNDYGDGSLVSYAAKAVMKYGCLFKDEDKVPSYSGSVAKQWGAKRTILNEWVDIAKKYLVKSAALISTWEEFVAAITNGYPIITGSNVGYAMKPSSDGFHRQQGSWSHALTFIGVDDRDNDPYALILNSWGDCHGELKDFDSDEILPVGVLRVRKSDAMKHVKAGETFALSQFDGFPDTGLDKLLFKLI